MRKEVEILFDNPPVESPVLSDEIQLMVKTIQFEESRVATIKKWIKEDGMEKQEAKDRFQKEMDAMVRDALGLPDETEQEKEYRLRAKATQEENERRAAELDADSEE
jgi:capsid protein